MGNRFENPIGADLPSDNEISSEQINPSTPRLTVEVPRADLLEKAQQDPRVHYVPSAEKVDFSADGGPIVDVSEYYKDLKSGEYESHKAHIFTFDTFVVHELNAKLQQDLSDEFPVSIRGVALNIGETINEGQPDEVLGISEVLKLGTERRERTGSQVPTMRYDAGDRFPHRSQHWLQQSPKELREMLDAKYKDQIFPAVLVYKDKSQLLGIYLTDYLDEQK